MTTETTSVSDATTQASGIDEVSDETTNQTVSFESHRKLLGEKKKQQAQLRDALAKLAEHETDRDAAETAKLEEQGRFKELLAAEQAKNSTLTQELGSYRTRVENSVKFNAIKKTLGADIPNVFSKLIDFSKVELDDGGLPDEMSVTKMVEHIRTELPQIIVSQATRGNLPNESPRGGATALSYEEWAALPVEEMKTRRNDVVD